jgi:hypothetical protein
MAATAGRVSAAEEPADSVKILMRQKRFGEAIAILDKELVKHAGLPEDLERELIMNVSISSINE